MIGYAIIVWYLDKILPGENGKSQPFYFPFQKSYWTHRKVKKVVLLDEKTWEPLNVRNCLESRMLLEKKKNACLEAQN